MGKINLMRVDDRLIHGQVQACIKCGVNPQQAIVLEDSMVGIDAANKAKICSCLIEDDIRDMPVRRRGIPISKKIVLESSNPCYQFNSLIEVIDFMKHFCSMQED